MIPYENFALKEFLKKLVGSKEFTFDIETSGLDPLEEGARIKCISFAFEIGKAYTLPTEGWSSEKWDYIHSVLKEILEDFTIRKIGQRLAFEHKWLKKIWNINLRGISHDTKIAHFELDKLTPSGLKSMAWSIGMGGYETSLSKSVEKCEGAELFSYCAADSDVECRIYLNQRKELDKLPKLDRYYKRIAIPLISEFSDLHLRGLRVDLKKLDSLNKLGAELLEKLRIDLLKNKWVQKASKSNPYDAGTFNPNSSRHVGYLIYGILGEPVKFRTAGGDPSVDKIVLQSLESKYPGLIEAIREYRATKKIYSTYIRNTYKHIKPDGRIHPTWSQTTARSGRSACSDPNLQNWPHCPSWTKKFDEKYWPVFAPRSIIIPDDGCEFGSADYSQQELRVAAAISRDPVMTKVFEEGGDIHMETARAVLGEDMEITEELRRAAKTTNFGIIYGISPPELARKIREEGGDCDESQAARYIAGHRRKYERYVKWTDEVIEFLTEHGYVESPTGRRRNFPPLEDLKQAEREAIYREAINTPIQGSAYDFLASAMVRFGRAREQYRLKSYIVNTIHDENIFNIFPGERDDVVEIYTEIAENPPEWLHHWLGSIPLAVDWNFSDKSWGDIK